MFEEKLRPGMTLGRYPQRQETWPGALETHTRRALDAVKFYGQQRKFKLRTVVNKIACHENAIKNLSEQQMTAHIQQLRQKLLRHGLQEELIALSFATVREVAWRVLGKRHFDVQLLGGWVMMHGMIAEMETGQGKTLAATLTTCTAALAGIPVHVVTANDYLAERDTKLLRHLYKRMGLTVAAVVDGMETPQRKAAYACDIVHSTSQQIAFDYLRDRMEMGEEIGKLRLQFKHIHSEQQSQESPFLLRGLCFTIIDEADSLLIDEAKTPLIISATRPDAEQQLYADALFLATSLDKKTDYTLDEQQNRVTLSDAGKTRLEQLAESLGESWSSRRRREIMVIQALKARYLFHKDKHYLVRDEKVQIIDPLTGRVMPDRSWEHGLHQLVEAKEGCEISAERDPLARISYQRFFKRYLRLAGMSGTVTEVAGELNAVYGLRVIKIPTHKPSCRQMLPEHLYKTTEQKSRAVINQVRRLHQQGRPVLIGTCSVMDSEKISAILAEEGLTHQVLNARQDQEEARIIARAGYPASITVATNMAGRGTDIQLGADVKARGGLHVIATARNEARRIDRQLYGRCARQGDPGSADAYLSLQDEEIEIFYSPAMLQLCSWFVQDEKPLPNWLGTMLVVIPQRWTEYKHHRLRRHLIKQDKQQAKTLAFTGRME